MPLLAAGEFALLDQHLEIAIRQNVLWDFVPTGDHDLYSLLVDAAVRRRDPVALHAYAPLAEKTAAPLGHKLYLGIAHRAWGVAHTLAGEYAQAEHRLQKAMDIFAAYPAPWQVGRTFFEMGELARAQRKRSQARDNYSRALSAFEELSADPDAQRARKSLEDPGSN